MAFTQADLDAINQAIASGEKTVQFSDRSTTYRSIEELIAAAKIIADQLAAPRSKQILAYSEKGF
jgi:hypothetical protein